MKMTFGQIAYRSWCGTFEIIGTDIPTWEGLTNAQREAWEQMAMEIVQASEYYRHLFVAPNIPPWLKRHVEDMFNARTEGSFALPEKAQQYSQSKTHP